MLPRHELIVKYSELLSLRDCRRLLDIVETDVITAGTVVKVIIAEAVMSPVVFYALQAISENPAMLLPIVIIVGYIIPKLVRTHEKRSKSLPLKYEAENM